MTTTTESKEQKRLRMAQLGYTQATRDGRCCLCGRGITTGMYVGRMPEGWQPKSRLRYAHRKCIEQLKAAIRAKAERLGIVVPANELVPDQVVPDQVRGTNLVPTSWVNTSDEVGADQHG